MKTLSQKSADKLRTCHKDIQKVITLAVSISDVDFGISEGERSVELQQIYFKEGKSKIDGIKVKGKHNYSPSEAVDIFAYVNGKASYDISHLSYLAGIIQACATLLFNEGVITHKIRWGGNWDRDGEILTDQSFDDSPHFEIVLP